MKRTPFRFFSVENREAHFPHRPGDRAPVRSNRRKGKASILWPQTAFRRQKQSIPTHTGYIMTHRTDGCNGLSRLVSAVFGRKIFLRYFCNVKNESEIFAIELRRKQIIIMFTEYKMLCATRCFSCSLLSYNIDTRIWSYFALFREASPEKTAECGFRCGPRMA